MKLNGWLNGKVLFTCKKPRRMATTDIGPDEMTPEAQAWFEPIREEWNRIYSRFLEDTRDLILRGGGEDKVNVQSYGDGYFSQLCLHLSYQGGLIKGERDQEVDSVVLTAE